MKGSNKMAPYVDDYFNKRMLSKLGYRFSGEDLGTDEVEAFNIISSVLNKHEESEMKKNRTKGRRHGR